MSIYKINNLTKAKQQVKFMNDNYKDNIDNTISKSKIYTGPLETIDWCNPITNLTPNILLIDKGTVETIFHLRQEFDNDIKIAALNFASYKNPGGRFIDGSNAQEEMLCHYSNLYNVLINFKDYYKNNNKELNRGLYTDKAIYSPDIVFNDKDKNIVLADVITCAAPNWSAAQYNKVSIIENILVFAQRINFIKTISEINNVNILILGAWGCGVFNQDPKILSVLFNIIFRQTNIQYIVYAIPKDINIKNYNIFKENLDINM